MPRTKKAAAETAEVKETAVVETAAPAEEKKTAAKKTAARKPAEKKTAAKKAEAESKVVIQANGSEVNAAELVEKAKAAAGVKTVKKVDVYVKPEVNKVYYVVNGDVFGEFDLF